MAVPPVAAHPTVLPKLLNVKTKPEITHNRPIIPTIVVPGIKISSMTSNVKPIIIREIIAIQIIINSECYQSYKKDIDK